MTEPPDTSVANPPTSGPEGGGNDPGTSELGAGAAALVRVKGTREPVDHLVSLVFRLLPPRSHPSNPKSPQTTKTSKPHLSSSSSMTP